MIGYVVSSGKASYTELCTVLGLEDLYDIVEIVSVDAHNSRIINAREPE